MQRINTILIGEYSAISAFTITRESAVDEMKQMIKNQIELNKEIHLLAADTENIDLYVLVSYLIREISPESKLICVTCSQNFLDQLQYFNHLTDDAVVIDGVEYHQKIYDEYVILPSFDDYMSLKHDFQEGKYEKTELILPSRDQIQRDILVYIGQCIDSHNKVTEKESTDFLKYLGIDSSNLRKLLHINDPFPVLSEKEYTWNHIYGRKPVFNIWQHMKESDQTMKSNMDSMIEDILQKVKGYILPELLKKGDSGFVIGMLDGNVELGLPSMLKKENDMDYDYLNTINRNTYEEIKLLDEETANEPGGPFGHRKECLDDLFSNIDDFLWQRYEIHRYQTMQAIYNLIIEGLSRYQFEFPTGEISKSEEEVFEKMQIFDAFDQSFLKTISISAFLNEISYDEIYSNLFKRQRTQPDVIVTQAEGGIFYQYTRKECLIREKEIKSIYLKSVQKKEFSLIIDGIQKSCIEIKEKRVILKEYNIEEINYKEMSLKELMVLLMRLKKEKLVPTGHHAFAIRHDHDYETLLGNPVFMESLKYSLETVRLYQKQMKDIEELIWRG